MSEQRWAVLENEAGELHVVPWRGRDQGSVAEGHLPQQLCPSCMPVYLLGDAVREAVFSHQQPGWPGEVVRRPQA